VRARYSRPLRWGIVLAALVAAGVFALRPAGKDVPTLTGAAHGGSGALQEIPRQANRLLGGGTGAFEARLASLRGTPVVVNQWASWCGPCRYEFPFFQRLARRYASRVAFLGVDSQDARSAAKAFLRQLPVPYPHYFDPDTKIARLFRGGQAWPTTAFYSAAGALAYTHIGAYASQAKLDADIRRYALHG
jgi:thiol-disulfide isomerase/thioredoxin